MDVLVVSSALNERMSELNPLLQRSELGMVTKWTGLDTWPEMPRDLAAVLVLEDDRDDLVDTLFDLRQQLNGNNVPVFVVPQDLGPNSRAKYLAAGASQVCSPDETNERLVAELQTAIDLGCADLNDLRMTLLQPFIAATVDAMEIMAGIRTRISDVMRKQDYKRSGDISGLIYLLAKTERLMACTFPRTSAEALAHRVLDGIADATDDEVVFDCVGELANIVAGQVKGRFVHTEYEFDISTPSIISGAGHKIHYRTELPSYVLVFKSDIGDFALQLCVRDREREPGK